MLGPQLYLHLKTMQSFMDADNCVDSEIAGLHLMYYGHLYRAINSYLLQYAVTRKLIFTVNYSDFDLVNSR